MSEYFNHDYLTYDNIGLLEVRCMASNRPIKVRVESQSKTNPTRTVYALGNNSDYREVPVLLADDTVSFIMLCDEMKNVIIGDEEASKLTDQIIRAKKMELEWSGQTDEVISAILNNMSTNKRVIRRLSPEEIKKRFSGGH